MDIVSESSSFRLAALRGGMWLFFLFQRRFHAIWDFGLWSDIDFPRLAIWCALSYFVGVALILAVRFYKIRYKNNVISPLSFDRNRQADNMSRRLLPPTLVTVGIYSNN